jgi:hypothetical protein
MNLRTFAAGLVVLSLTCLAGCRHTANRSACCPTTPVAAAPCCPTPTPTVAAVPAPVAVAAPACPTCPNGSAVPTFGH